jgi:hypothetical protein
MSSKLVILWSGIALLVGGLLTLVFTTIYFFQLREMYGSNTNTSHISPSIQSLIWQLPDVLVVFGSLLLIIALPAIYVPILDPFWKAVVRRSGEILTILIFFFGLEAVGFLLVGIGLTPSYKPGVGFSSMCERAEELGGSCIIEFKPAGGTLVYAQLPLT